MDALENQALHYNILTYDKHFIECFNNCLNKEKIGEIHSVYSKTINFLDNKENMYTIGVKKIDNSPYTVRLDTETLEFSNFQFRPKTPIFKLNNSIVIENKIKIDFNTDSKLWNTDIKPIKEIDRNIIFNRIEHFNQLIMHKGSYGGCKYYYLKNYLQTENDKASLIEKELCKKIESFICNIQTKNINREIITSLIGFGAGLTPSGDDFITGFLSAINIISINYTNKIKNELRHSIDINKISTTDVSKQMLLTAINGETREYIINFISSFFNKGEENFLFSLNNLLSIGYSSGTDIAIGVVMAFIIIINNSDREE
ncbi:DUF2877 domain-containing protein [Sedimentibacter sp.]|uniref:DUF2877 domain-containing protein n=1 Tax=Sedimentibacter sp. TaxID=1960295 RepID=UPI000EC4275C|nr:DUF2877 domain-containing protein [Sedimentibacter sp.]HCX61564.1 hypothetical protein [Clostridiales bacterium]